MYFDVDKNDLDGPWVSVFLEENLNYEVKSRNNAMKKTKATMTTPQKFILSFSR